MICFNVTNLKTVFGGYGPPGGGAPSCKCIHQTGYEWWPNVSNCDSCFDYCGNLWGSNLKSTWCVG